MGIPSKPCYDSFSQIPPKQHKEKLWDPIATLDIINPDRGRLTCVGHAVTCGRRCRNPINQANQFSAFQLLQELSYIDTSTTDINAKLHCLAKLTLCVRYHYNQADDMAKKWSKEINQLQEASRNRTDIKIEPESLEEVLINLQKLLDRLNKNMTADAIPFSSPASQYYQEQFGRNSAQEEEAAKRRKEEMCKSQEQERQQQEREKREQEGKEQKQREEEERRKKEQQARDREAREREERKERIRQEAEQLRKEQERKEKERKKREAEEEKRQEEQRARDKEVREREERNERCRRRAEKAKEDRERKERELKAKAREEWDKAWLDYVLRWDDLKKTGVKNTSGTLLEIIPWPVKSRDWKDVSESAVEEFFRKASPETNDVEKRFAIMKMECLKWHTDRIPKMFGVIEDKSLARLFTIVAQVAIPIRAEINGQRKR